MFQSPHHPCSTPLAQGLTPVLRRERDRQPSSVKPTLTVFTRAWEAASIAAGPARDAYAWEGTSARGEGFAAQLLGLRFPTAPRNALTPWRWASPGGPMGFQVILPLQRQMQGSQTQRLLLGFQKMPSVRGGNAAFRARHRHSLKASKIPTCPAACF